jgi:hypothetical protein
MKTMANYHKTGWEFTKLACIFGLRQLEFEEE